MFDAAIEGSFMGLYVQGEDILQSDPNTKHVVAALSSMQCVIVHDLFLNETANYAHVFLPGSTFLERMEPSPMPNGGSAGAQGHDPAQWAGRLGVTIRLAKAMGFEMPTITRRRSWTRSPR